MATYRIFRVGRDGRLLIGDVFEAEDDSAAIIQVSQSERGAETRELWQGGRLVGRFSALGVFSPGGAVS